MRKCLLLFTFFLAGYISSYAQGLSYTCPRDTILGCGINCFDLFVKFPDVRDLGDDYSLQNNSNVSQCYPFIPPGEPGPSTNLIIDDRYSSVIPLPFPFRFYGTVYNSLIVSTNGFVSFDVSNTGTFSHYQDRGNLPNAQYDAALIMGPYHDLDPSITTSPTQQIKYQTFGTAPNRRWVLSYYRVPLFDCDNLIENTHQIVLHETSGIVEVDIVDKQICTSWQGGRTMVGMQNFAKDRGIMAPGRAMTDPPWGSIGMNEVWRFIPTGGAPLYRSVELLDASGATIAVGDTIRQDAATFGWTFPNICPATNAPTLYVVKTTYVDPANPTQTIFSLDTINVTRNAMPVSATATSTSCGTNTGTVTVTANGGAPPLTYTLNPGAVTNATGIFTGLAAGVYTITVTDASGNCSNTVAATVDLQSNLAGTFVRTNASCPGVSDGSITVTPTTGVAPFTFSANGGPSQASGIFTNLTPGTYNIVFTDASGCTGTITATVGPGSNIAATATSTAAACVGSSSGTITVTPSGGVAPYTYSLNGGPAQTSNVFTGVPPGTHIITVVDSRGCTITEPETVGSGAGLSGAIFQTPVSCPGLSDGTVTLNPTTGLAPFTYQLNGGPSQASNTFTGLASTPTPYTVTFTDANGCQGNRSILVGGGTAPSTTATAANTYCAGANDGVIVFQPIAGSTYTVNPGGYTNTTGTFLNLPANTYTLAITTSGGCAGTVTPSTITINPGAALSTSSTSSAASCPGVNNGSITVTPIGTGTTTYTLNPGAVTNTTGIFNGLAAGTYTISFVTSAGCTGTVSPNPVVNAAAAPTTTATAAATGCPGVSDGTITVTPVGAGTTYTLNPGAVSNTTGVFTGLAAGPYTITFVTAAGCNGTVTGTPTVAAGPAPTTTAAATSTSCPTVNDGVITVVPVAAGTTYTLNPGAVSNTTGVFTGLPPGSYTITFVTPASCNGTTLPVSTTVTAGPFRSSSFTKTDPVCNNLNNGSISITPTAPATGPYSVTLTGPGGPYTLTGPAPVTFTALAPGTYNYSFTDAGGCTGTGGPVTLVTNPPIFVPAAFVNPSCNGSSNGSVTFTPFGGVAPYQYSITGGTYQTANTFSNLAVGTYNFTIRDNVGCTKDTSITLTQPAVLAASVTGTTPAGCSNNDGTLTATATGGTVAYTYTIAGPTVNTTGVNSGVFTGLANGAYTVTVRDSKGCTASATATVNLTDNMFLTLGPDVTICAESSVTFDPQTNALTNVFTWRGINGTATNSIANPNIKNAVASPLDTATYELHAQWGTCERRDTIVVNVLRKPVANAGQDTAICNNTYAILRGSASNVSGAVTYEWAPTTNVEFPTQAVTRVFPASSDTTYTYTLIVRDAYGCNFAVSDQVDVRVQPPVPAYAGNDTTAVRGVPHQLTASGGSNYLWSPPAPLNNATAQNPLATLQEDQKFIVRVTDFAGCIGYDTVFVKVYAGPAYYVPNAFTPNGDGLNDIFRPIPVGVVRTEWFRVFNRYGETIFETNQWMKGWDGTFKGKKQAVGAYVWVIKGIDRDGKVIEMKGTVMLVQ